MQLELDKIRRDGGTQPRASMDAEAVKRYAHDLKEGVAFDPVEVVYDGTNYWCWDGFHRCAAAISAGCTEIEVNVRQGTQEDAQWLSLSANRKHGMPRTNDDKRSAVRRALEHRLGQEMSDNQLALHIGVSQPFVGRVRKGLATYNGYKSTERTGHDGRKIHTANIGKHATKHRKPKPGISRRAHLPTRGHSSPCPMIPLQFSPNNPTTAAATIVREFSREFIQSLVQELSEYLSHAGDAV